MSSIRRILFFGTPTFSAKSLSTLLDPKISEISSSKVVGVVTQPDRPAGRGHKLLPSPVKELALSHNLPVLQPNSLRKELSAFKEFAQALGPIDLGIVVAFGQILPKEVLELPRRGCVNVHASLLPRWRGAAPIQRAIMSADPQSGVCLMQMDEGLDTGAVYAQAELDIDAKDTFSSLHDRLADLGASLLGERLAGILSGSLPAVPQSGDGVTYAKKVSSAEAELKFQLPAAQLSATIRGLSPHPGAYCFLKGQRLKLLMAQESPHREPDKATPGTILRADASGIEIQCGTGSIVCSELQLEGKKRLSATDFLRGTQITAGERLEDSPPPS